MDKKFNGCDVMYICGYGKFGGSEMCNHYARHEGGYTPTAQYRYEHRRCKHWGSAFRDAEDVRQYMCLCDAARLAAYYYEASGMRVVEERLAKAKK
jgi:hypothetical protein